MSATIQFGRETCVITDGVWSVPGDEITRKILQLASDRAETEFHYWPDRDLGMAEAVIKAYPDLAQLVSWDEDTEDDGLDENGNLIIY